MIKRLVVILLAILYFGISAGANVQCQLWMGPMAAMHGMMKGSRDCAGMSAKEKQERDCCKRACQDLKSAKLTTLTVEQQVLSVSPAILPNNSYLLQNVAYLPVAASIAVNQPPPIRRDVPLFLRLRNFRI